MTLFPICKMLETLIDGLYLNVCPWITAEGIDSADKYLDMARITVITISYTVFLALLYLICKGWNTI